MESYDTILNRMKEAYEQAGGCSVEDVSEADLRLRVLAGELYRLQAEIKWIARQAFPYTATGEWLDRHGQQRGLARREATHAVGVLTFSRYLPLSFDVVIPKGTVCATAGEVPAEYETTENVVLSAGELTVDAPARAVAGGSMGNAAPGFINTLTAAQNDVDYVTNQAAFTGGAEAEDDEAYRARVLEAYKSAPNGINAAYYRDAALSVEGVAAVGVKPRVDGPNTVGVYLWGRDGAPTEETVAAVEEALESRREIGVTLTVGAARQTPVNVRLQMSVQPGADFDRAAAAVTAALTRYFDGLTVGSPVYLTELTRAVLEAAPIAELEFAPSVRDVAGEADAIPTAGTITVEAME